MFTIYKLVSPESKVYIGCTSHTQLSHRFGVGGSGYMNQKVVWTAIQRLGWKNFTHEVLERCESRTYASERERFYINLYDSTNPEKGYNVRPGGLGAPLPPVAPATARKISESKQGYVWVHRHQECRLVPPDKVNEMLDAGWERGGRPLTDAEKQHLREINLGKSLSQETRAKLSAQRTGCRFIHKGDIEKHVPDAEVASYLANGWALGRPDRVNMVNRLAQQGKTQSKETRAKRSQSMQGKLAGRCQIHKDGICKLVPKSELESYLEAGWQRGVGKRNKR